MIKSRKVGVFYFLGITYLILSAGSPCYARDVLELTLKEAVGISLSENLSMAEEGILFKAAEAGIKLREGEFDPGLKFQLSGSLEKSQATTAIQSPEQSVAGYEVSLGGKIGTGTAYELKWSGTRVRSVETQFLLVNPYYSSGLVLSVTQPVLRGAGRAVQESGLRVARNSVEIARLRTEHRAMDIIARTVSAYWSLYFARNNLHVAELSVGLAENILKEVRTKIDVGVLAPVDIYRAEAELAIRQERFLRAEKAVSDAEDALRAVMNLTDWQREIVPVEAPPGPGEIPLLEEVLETAFQNRRDYMQALIEHRNKEMLRRFYRNQRLPELNITAGVGLNGLGESYGNALSSATSGDYYSWQIGLSLNIPIRNRTAKGKYLIAKHEEELADLKIKALRQGITVEVREAVRAVKLARENIKATEKTRIASEKRLEAEETRFRLGMTTLNDVLMSQQEYTEALSSEKRALTNYAKAVITLQRVSGLIRPLSIGIGNGVTSLDSRGALVCRGRTTPVCLR